MTRNGTSAKKSSQTFTYDAFRFTRGGRGGPQLVLFHAPVDDVLKWATVEELGPKTKGAQRQRKEAKVEAIRKFLAADKRNVIPTAVVVAFTRSKASFRRKSEGYGELSIRPRSAFAAAVVDGQHRLHGMHAFDRNTIVPLVGLLDADDVEKAFHFLVINNKATRVPATHAKALFARMEGTVLAERLRVARLAFDADGIKDVDLVNTDPDSPFFQAIDWPTTPQRKRMVPATAIELSLDYLEGLGVPALDDRDVRRSIFLAIWRVAKEVWSKLWVPNSRLVSKVGIVCFTRFVSDLIVNWADNDDLDIEVSDLDDVEEQTRKIVKYMNAAFWTAPWAEKAHGGFDTNQGRDRVLAALKQLYRNGKSKVEWYSDIDIIDRASAEK